LPRNRGPGWNPRSTPAAIDLETLLLRTGAIPIGMSFQRDGDFPVPIIEIRPGRRLADAAIEVDLSEASGDAAAQRIFRAILEANARILGFMCTMKGSSMACVGILDLTDSRVGAEDLRSAISGMRFVRSFEISEGPVEGFAAVRGIALESAGARSVLMSTRALSGLFGGAADYLGEEAGAAFTYYEGLFAGRGMGGYLLQFGRDAALAMLPRVWEARGYATRVEMLSDTGGGRHRFEVRRLIECEVLSPRYRERGWRKRTSNYFRGMIAGALSALEGGEWDVEEVECVNDGSDRCAFEARRRGIGGAGP